MDVHICGTCRTEFHDFVEFFEHKKSCSSAKQRPEAPLLVSGVNVESGEPYNNQEDDRTQSSVLKVDEPVLATPALLQLVGHEYAEVSGNVETQTMVAEKDSGMQFVSMVDSNYILMKNNEGETFLIPLQSQAGIQDVHCVPLSYPAQEMEQRDGVLTIDPVQNQSPLDSSSNPVVNPCLRMELDHNGTYSLLPRSHLPAGLLPQGTESDQSIQVTAPNNMSDHPASSSSRVLDNSVTHMSTVLQPNEKDLLCLETFSSPVKLSKCKEDGLLESNDKTSKLQSRLTSQSETITGISNNLPRNSVVSYSDHPQDGSRLDVIAAENLYFVCQDKVTPENQTGNDSGYIASSRINTVESSVTEEMDNEASTQNAEDMTVVNDSCSQPREISSQYCIEINRQPSSHDSSASVQSLKGTQINETKKARSTKSEKKILPKKSKEDTKKKTSDTKPKKLPSRYRCDMVESCTFETPYLKDLERHIRTHTGEKPYACSYCERRFSRKDKLQLHIRAHKNLKPYACGICSYKAVDSSTLKKHMEIHTDERHYECQLCPYSARTSSQLTIHLRTHTGDTPFNCPYCPAKFKIKSDMKRHFTVHTGEKPFKCDKCDVSCSTRGNLQSHVRTHHSSEKQVKCDSCGYTTSSKRCFREHLKLHGDINSELVCPICRYISSNKESHKIHVERHAQRLKCYYCDYVADSKLQIQHHRRQCSKAKYGKRHSYRESEDKKYSKTYKCDLCNESFVRKDSLKSHITLHRERAMSKFSTALTVLELQQPVHNSTESSQYYRTMENSSRGHRIRENSGVRILEQQKTSVSELQKPAHKSAEVSQYYRTMDCSEIMQLEKQRTGITSRGNLIDVSSGCYAKIAPKPGHMTSVGDASQYSEDDTECMDRQSEVQVVQSRSNEQDRNPATVVSKEATALADISGDGNANNASLTWVLPTPTSVSMETGSQQQSGLVPSIQLIQNISFPMVQLPNGQMVALPPQSAGQMLTWPSQGSQTLDLTHPVEGLLAQNSECTSQILNILGSIKQSQHPNSLQSGTDIASNSEETKRTTLENLATETTPELNNDIVLNLPPPDASLLLGQGKRQESEDTSLGSVKVKLLAVNTGNTELINPPIQYQQVLANPDPFTSQHHVGITPLESTPALPYPVYSSMTSAVLSKSVISSASSSSPQFTATASSKRQKDKLHISKHDVMGKSDQKGLSLLEKGSEDSQIDLQSIEMDATTPEYETGSLVANLALGYQTGVSDPIVTTTK